jgi:flagellar motor switch protein FliG
MTTRTQTREDAARAAVTSGGTVTGPGGGVHAPHVHPPQHHATAGVGPRPVDAFAAAADIETTPLRKAAILLVSLEQPLASQLLAHLDRAAVEAVTLEIARLERVELDEQHAVLEEFYGLGLRRLRFVFEDLVKMDDTDISEAYHDEDATTWALALAGASRPVRTKVLGALPGHSAEPLRDHLDHLGPFRLSDAEAAQADIAERLRRLHDHGRITLPDPNGQEEILV